MSLETRLRRLESASGVNRIYVVLAHFGEAFDTVIAAAGIAPGENDMVIRVNRYAWSERDGSQLPPPIPPDKRLISVHARVG